MGFLDKVKNMFIEELEEEDVIKKEVIQVKIPKPDSFKPQKEVKQEVVEKEEVSNYKNIDMVEADRSEALEKEELNSRQAFPKYFDDSDFEMIDKKVEPPVIKQEYKYTKVETTYTPVISGYNGKKQEETKKVFQSSPIISPVYGVLDKNYRKDEISSKKKPVVEPSVDTFSVDDIRKKAFGTLEDELEKNLTLSHDLFNYEDDLFADDIINNDIDVTDETIDIFGELEKKDALEDLLSQYDFTKEEIYGSNKNSGSLVEEELNRNYDKYEEELNESYTRELDDTDLFNLIDSMYDKKEDEE